MAWIKCQNKKKIESKLVLVDIVSFPDLNIDMQNCSSVVIRSDGFYGHTAGDGCKGWVKTGNFDTKNYKTIVVKCINNSWGTSVPEVYLYVNGLKNSDINGTQSVTVDLAGRTEMNLTLQFSGNGTNDAWMDASIQSIEFIP